MEIKPNLRKSSSDELERRGASQRQTKALYPDHRLPPRPSEGASRDRSNRLLGANGSVLQNLEGERANL